METSYKKYPLHVAVLLVVASCTAAAKPNTAASPAVGSLSERAFRLDRKGLLARQLRVETLVATCMKKQGFDYWPVDPSTVLVGQGKFAVTGLTEDDFRKQYGYGITTTYDISPAKGTAAEVNPNAKIRDALSPADQPAYEKALNGGSKEGSFSDAVLQGDFGKLAGCNKSAAAEVFGGVDALNVVQTVIDEVDKRVTADPQMVRAERQWTECLIAAGFKFSTSDQIDEGLRRRLKAIVGAEAGNTSYDKAALAALQQEEIRTAEADWACEIKYKAPIEPKVIAAVEKSYFEAHPGLAEKVKG